MIKKINILIVFLVLINILPSVIAIKPLTSTTNTEGYFIHTPLIDYLKKNQSMDFNFHVYNYTNGVPINNASTKCYFHLYNNSGDHILFISDVEHDAVTEHGVVNEWVVRVNGNNFSRLGFYSYIIQCNSSTQGGFSEFMFEVTQNGRYPASHNFLIFYYICFILVVCLMIWLLINNIAKLATLSFNIYDLSLTWSFFFCLMILYWLGVTYIMDENFTHFVGVLISITIWTHCILPLMSFIITFIKQTLDTQKPRGMK